MTSLLVEPEIVTAAVADIETIGSTVTAASAAAAAPTSNLLAAAADEVSVAFANLFGAYGKEFQAVVGQVEAFQTQFQRTLAAAANAYVQTELATVTALQGALGAAAAPNALAAAVPPPPFPALNTAVFIGPTGVPIPPPAYVTFANELYVHANGILTTLFTPEELYPITGVKSSTLNQSVSEGLTILENYVQAQFAAGESTTVFGYSQSAIISSLLMYKLAAMGSPNPDMLNFILVGNEMNPNGGLLARFPNLTLPTLGLTFYGATPSDTLYNTAIYTQEYDGFASFPRYPLNFISDLNAVIGIATVHTKYLDLTPAQVANAIQLETSPGYYENGGKTYYYMIPTDELPILTPLRAIPVIGRPLAALIEPNVEVIVNLGYGDPYHGYSTGYADVQTPFGLFPEVSPQTLVEAFSAGTQQGIHDFNLELQSLSANPPTVPALIPPQPVDFVNAVAKLPAPEEVVNTAAEIISTDYAVLLPTADTALAFATTMPLYNAQLFLSELAKGNLINALGYPLAADVGLATVAGIVELLVIGKALSENITALQALFA
ncbi:PE family protein [Mycobacterium bourgelatii]|uniref:PE family protein n=1 Tax=Mycobacterium bourgelatii TaxID=1273442 RepID=A0A7I9YK62_MYCBU|nr:PE-PPE domain-containing protein [Mycobacterium bourgelatii]MCV6974609.1 PE-PPE domain-containing protein [Mycobacterium bourgelatii]GFG89076.1 PE family protein [Mycobacterium bourgelatii]